MVEAVSVLVCCNVLNLTLPRFRWAYYQLQELEKLPSTKPKYITEAPRTLLMTLDETYVRMLTRLPPLCVETEDSVVVRDSDLSRDTQLQSFL